MNLEVHFISNKYKLTIERIRFKFDLKRNTKDTVLQCNIFLC